MLQAVTQDLARLPNCSVCTTLEAGLNGFAGVDVVFVNSSAEETQAFRQCLQRVDAVLVIAPETNGILLQRCQSVLEAGVTLWNCSPSAIELCGDKLRLYEHLASHGIPTIPTKVCHLDEAPEYHFPFPMVVKPRDGAGSFLTFQVNHPREWAEATLALQEAGLDQKCICQPYIRGRSLSVGINLSFDRQQIECLPVGEQTLSSCGRFRYLGGRIPANIPAESASLIFKMLEATCLSIEGLAGYIGVDVILDEQGQPILVEINPRLTTSYIGYRQLISGSLPEFWFDGRRHLGGLRSDTPFIEFSTDESNDDGF